MDDVIPLILIIFAVALDLFIPIIASVATILLLIFIAYQADLEEKERNFVMENMFKLFVAFQGRNESEVLTENFAEFNANAEQRNEALSKNFTEFNKLFETVDAKINNISKQIMNNIKTDIKDLVAEVTNLVKLKKVGEGGYGVVKRAETIDKKQVALKCLIERRSSEIDGKIIENFTKELKTIRGVSYHDNIISFLGISKNDTGYIMLLEYANEGNLRDYLTKKFESLEWEKKIRMVLDITCGLQCLHLEGIIHRDLAINNLILYYSCCFDL
ncbi:kinase-like domain-containing protein [Rhizophagus clarus]|uniref:Kinase-like domain-containing protein n=1 Tax=Rhizophagus clarus TaxID=94130 RepID=A0A8H3MFZ7_9GLOM|nr:kinase-like domain-containing protein [Rhizophagus clarus]